MASIHPSAVVHEDARLSAGVEVGPFAVVGAGVRAEAGVVISAHAVVEGDTWLGQSCRIASFACIGAPPQTRSHGAPGRLEIGPRTVIREYVTAQPGVEGGTTRVGAGCLVMAYAHIAHDCALEDGVVMANGVQLAGHCHVGEATTLGGLTNVHQHVRIGRLAMTGAASRITRDVPPFCLVDGHPARLIGPNRVGLRRAGWTREETAELTRTLIRCFPKDGRVTVPEDGVRELLAFLRASTRGVTTRRRRDGRS